MSGARYYFPFLDGALGYDCVRCGAACCKGLGFGLGPGELVPLLLRRPQLAPFVQPRADQSTVLDLTDEGCWFLLGDGRCGVEVEDGRAAKPSTCRLFPFNRLHHVGELRVVEPQLLRCPLQDLAGPAGLAGRGPKHAELSLEIDALSSEIPWMSTKAPPALADDWAERETRLRDASAAFLDEPDPLSVLLLDGGADEARLRALRDAWRLAFAVDGAEATRLDALVARPLALLLPALRFGAIFAAGASPYPKLLRQLPALSLAGAFFSSLAARALGRAPSLRSLAEIHRATFLERELLARWDRPARLRAPLPSSPLPALAAQAFTHLGQLLDGKTPIGERFETACATVPTPLRPLIIRALSDKLALLDFA